MFSLLKTAIKKDSSTNKKGKDNNLDDFFHKRAEKDGTNEISTADMTSRRTGKENSGLRSIRSEFRASEYGLVITDLDKEKEESAKSQSALTEGDATQHQAGTRDWETAVPSGVVETSGTVDDVRGHGQEGSDKLIGGEFNDGNPLLGSLDNEGQDSAENENQRVNKNTPSQQNDPSSHETSPRDTRQEIAEEEGDSNVAGWTPRNLDQVTAAGAGQAEPTGAHAQGGLDGETIGLLTDEGAQHLNQQAVEDEQIAFQYTESIASDKRLDLQDHDGLQSGPENVDDAVGDEESTYDKEAYEANDNRSEQGCEEQDEASNDFKSSMSDTDSEEQPADIDEGPNGDETFAGENHDPDVVEHLPIFLDGPIEQAEDYLEEDDGLEGAEDPEQDGDIEGDEQEDSGVDGDRSLHGDDNLDPTYEHSITENAVVDEEDIPDQGPNSETQLDLNEPASKNPLAVPGKHWTEAHMSAFRIHVRSKANIFDFLGRKGIPNRERVAEVVAESLKLCLKDSTALRGKTHATVFLEAGGTPLGPFLAFLALTVQSTMNSSKGEKNAKDDKNDEKNAEDGDGASGDEEKSSEDEGSQPASAIDEADPWDDFDLEDDLEAPPSYFEPRKPGPVAPKASNDCGAHCKRPEVATNIMVVMFLQAILESSRAAISGPARAYLEWTFIPQPLQINSGPANCEDENYGSLHEKRSQRTAAFHLKWEDVNPLEYVSIGVSRS